MAKLHKFESEFINYDNKLSCFRQWLPDLLTFFLVIRKLNAYNFQNTSRLLLGKFSN